MFLEIENMHTYYGTSHVLQGLSITVDKGEVVSLLGRNGAGKTTTLRSIMGLNPPRSGSINFLGETIAGLPTHQIAQKGIAFVPEDRRIVPNLTVYENLKLGMLKNKDKDRMEELLERAFTYFPKIKERLSQEGKSLSGGEQQMLAIIRGLVADPNLMLVDEPTEGLMPKLVENLANVLAEINRAGVTIMLVEQNMEVALSISSRVYVLDEGIIQFHGTPETLAENKEIQQKFLGV